MEYKDKGSSQLMRIAISILITAITVMPSISSATDEEAQRWSIHYNTVFEYNMKASGEVIQKFGKPFRVVAWLRECKLDALAKTIEPSNEEIQIAVVQYLREKADRKEFFWDVLAGSMASVDLYRIGFGETAEPIHKLLGEKFCTSATEEANDLMRKRDAAK
ncbi:MAG TPA: hypothetical protein VKT22_07510 [Steroidobacteraceae bacterium]|nr:hypothetical protein [Steroidobacteraceae bacterium]